GMHRGPEKTATRFLDHALLSCRATSRHLLLFFLVVRDSSTSVGMKKHANGKIWCRCYRFRAGRLHCCDPLWAAWIEARAGRERQGTRRNVPECWLHPEQSASHVERSCHVRKKGSRQARNHDRQRPGRSSQNGREQKQSRPNDEQRCARPDEDEQGDDLRRARHDHCAWKSFC